MTNATWQQFWRVRTEASFDAASPEGGAEWNIGGNGGGANGWMDLPVIRESDGLQPKNAVIYPSTASGNRAMNSAAPIAGADLVELGSLEMAFYPELCDRVLRALMGSVSRAETAGAAALASTVFASLATLDTQPNGTEQLKFTIASSTAASAAAINIIQNSVTVETITIGTSASSVDGVYYSKGAYDGSTNAITFSVSGTVTSGTVVVAGVDYSTNEFTVGTTNPTLVIEQGGRVEAGSGNSEYFPGIVLPGATFNYDRSAADGLLMMTLNNILGIRPDTATAGTYQNDAAEYYKPFASWTGAVEIDGASNTEFVSAQININPNNELLQTSTGNQQPSGKIEGEFESFGSFNILPTDTTFWDAFRNQTLTDVNITFTTPFFVVDSVGFSIAFNFTELTFSDYQRNRAGAALGSVLPWRAIYNTTDGGPVKVTTVCRMPV